MLALGVQGVGGDHHSGQVQPSQGVQQRSERGDLVGLAVHRDLPEHDPHVVIDHRKQVPRRPVIAAALTGVAGAPQGLAVHREHPPPPARSPSRAQALDERADQRIEPVAVQALHDAPDRRLARITSDDPERGSHLGGQVGNPLGDRDE